jgi:LPXTG-motif cell wall-anchored protein
MLTKFIFYNENQNITLVLFGLFGVVLVFSILILIFVKKVRKPVF